jgi:hypothetical protein
LVWYPVEKTSAAGLCMLGQLALQLLVQIQGAVQQAAAGAARAVLPRRLFGLLEHADRG